MQNYYLTNPLICLFCGNPYNIGLRKIHISDRIWECGECGVRFNPKISITELIKGSELYSAFGDFSDDIPLVWWQTALNPLEESYIKWLIREKPQGKYYILWPWNDVRFLPILIAEYLFSNPNSKIAVVTVIKKQINIGDVPSLEEKLRSLASIEIEKFKDYEDCVDERAKRRIKNINSRLFRKIFTIKKSVSLDLRKAIYLKRNLWNYLCNFTGIKLFLEQFPIRDFRSDSQDYHRAFDKAPEIIHFGSRLFLINNNLDHTLVVEKIQKIHPDLLILEGKSLPIITSDLGSSIVIGFSTQILYRSLYTLENIRSSKGITIHSLDNDIITGPQGIIPQIREEDISDFRRRGEIFSPLSNHPATIHKKFLSVPIKYVPLPELDELDEHVQLFCSLLDSANLSDEPGKFFLFVKHTPLDLIPKDPTCNTYFETRISKCNAISVLRKINDLKQSYPTYLPALREFETALKHKFEVPNPLQVKLFTLLRELLIHSHNHFFIVVYQGEENKLNQILTRTRDFSEEDLIRISITSPRLLEYDLKKLGSQRQKTVISFVLPHKWLYSCQQVEQVLFLGSKKNLNQIETSIKFRIFDGLFPVFTIESSQQIPVEIRPLLDKTRFTESVPNNNTFLFCTYANNTIQADSQSSTNVYEGSYEIQAGEECYIVLSDTNAFFLPAEKRILVFNNDTLFPTPINDHVGEELLGFSILYHSNLANLLRKIFYEFMFQQRYLFSYSSQRDGFFWKDFEELYQAAIKWLQSLKEIVQIFLNESNLELKEAEFRVLNQLNQVGLSQKPNYILNNWIRAKPEEIETDFGIRYIFDIEHPKDVSSLTLIYSIIAQYLPGQFSALDARKDFSAIRMLQNVRNQLLFKEIYSQEGNVQQDYHDFILEKLKKNNQLEGIPIQHVRKVKLAKNVMAFRKISEWENLIEE